MGKYIRKYSQENMRKCAENAGKAPYPNDEFEYVGNLDIETKCYPLGRIVGTSILFVVK